MLRTKEEKDHPDCYQQQVQKPGSVMVWGCVSALGKGNLHFCDGQCWEGYFENVIGYRLQVTLFKM